MLSSRIKINIYKKQVLKIKEGTLLRIKCYQYFVGIFFFICGQLIKNCDKFISKQTLNGFMDDALPACGAAALVGSTRANNHLAAKEALITRLPAAGRLLASY